MKIQLLSDLHLESHPDFHPRPAAGADALLLAGDIGSYQRGTKLKDRHFGLERFSPLRGWPVPVIYLPGNHEYDLLDFDETHARLRDCCDELGITWLEREVLAFDGLRLVGTTLWSDFDAFALKPGEPAGDTARLLKLRHKAYRAANYYLEKAASMRGGGMWLAEGWREQALVCQDWLRAALATPFDGITVAVTHFAPTLLSADPRYGMAPGTAGFCNSLDELLPQAHWWLHGHLHCQFDYVSQGCRVVANPLGYASKGEQEGFREDFVLDLRDLSHRPT